MVKLEGLTGEEIEKGENKRKAEENTKKYFQLVSRFPKIAEEMFDTPSFFGFFGEKRVDSGYWCSIHDISVYVNISPFPYIEGKIEGNTVELDIHNWFPVHDPSKNILRVHKPNGLNDALKLARAYEEAGFGEFTVKKQYEE